MVEFQNRLNLDNLRRHESLPVWWNNDAFKLWEGDLRMRIYPQIDSDTYISVTWGTQQGLTSLNPEHTHQYVICGDRHAEFSVVSSDGDIIAAQIVDDDVDPEDHFQTEPPRDPR